MAPRTAKQFEEIRKERREEILEAALELFAQEGYHTSSISKIAKKAGVSKGLIYNYFENKQEILVTLIKQSFTDAVELMDIDVDVPLTREKFIHSIEASIDMTAENPYRWKLYTTLMFQPDVMPIAMSEAMPVAEPFMRHLVEYFRSQGHEDPGAMMRVFMAMMDGVQMQLIINLENHRVGMPAFPIELAKKMLIEQFA